MSQRIICQASDISRFLSAKLDGQDLAITQVGSLKNITPGQLVFVKDAQNFSEDLHIAALYLVPQGCSRQPDSHATFIQVDNPRLAFAKVLTHFFCERQTETMIHPTAVIDPSAEIGDKVYIGAHTVIDANVRIGVGTKILNHVHVAKGVQIGAACFIKSSTVIGEPGFGFAFEQDKTPVRLPHLGAVSIGDHVEIGSLTTVVCGTLDDTVIRDHVKIDDHVHIAHNCYIGEKTIITACAELSGSVRVGCSCWVGPNASLINGITVGDNVLIGIGAVIDKDVADNKKMMGLVALNLRALTKFKREHHYDE